MAHSNLYATDGLCHNAEPGTYGHECGKNAAWVGTDRNGFASGFCDDCRRNGAEARAMVSWEKAPYISEPNPKQRKFATRQAAEIEATELNAARRTTEFEYGVSQVRGGWQLCSYHDD